MRRKRKRRKRGKSRENQKYEKEKGITEKNNRIIERINEYKKE